MSKTVTVRLEDAVYEKIKNFAQAERRPISNFIENATLNYVEETAFADDLEMIEILSNKELLSMLKQGSKDAKEKRGRIV
ncbi:MAG: CopG family transcriptional regulator [bacterium]|nr:CopG family transcriptional regulator [bacterium]